MAPFRKGLYIAGLVILAALIAGWMTFQHIPSWYQPLWLSHAEVQAVHKRLQQTFEIISQKLNAGEPFSITLNNQQVNEMFSAQDAMWPAARNGLDPRLDDPCVDIQPSGIRLGLHRRWESIQSILSLEIAPVAKDGQLILHLHSVRAGSLPIPVGWLARLASAFRPDRAEGDNSGTSAGQAPGRRIQQVLEQLLANGGHLGLDNHFTWPNGEVDFRIVSVALARQKITLEIEPGTRRQEPGGRNQ